MTGAPEVRTARHLTDLSRRTLMVSTIGRHASATARRRDGLVAAALGALVLLVAAVTVGVGAGAQAATQTFQLYSQVNPLLQPTPDNQGSQELSMTVTPASAAPVTRSRSRSRRRPSTSPTDRPRPR